MFPIEQRFPPVIRVYGSALSSPPLSYYLTVGLEIKKRKSEVYRGRWLQDVFLRRVPCTSLHGTTRCAY